MEGHSKSPFDNMERLKIKTVDYLAPAVPPNQCTERYREAGYFIKGPLPLNWWLVACGLSDSVLAVASAFWFVAGLKKY